METLYYKTLLETTIVEQEINKSKFITYLVPVQTEDEAKEALRIIKKEHPKANHHCSAYIVDEIERSNDDGEPASSAGLPMLQVLQGNQCNYTLAVVVRYFGGVKLGVGGLIRAYGSSVTQAIQASEMVIPRWVYTVRLTFPYEYINAVETHSRDVANIIDRQYEDSVIYEVQVLDPQALEDLNDMTRGTIELDILKKEIELIKESNQTD